MMFGHIETIIGGKLPASAFRHRAWWSNNPSNSVMTRAWLEAGYISAEVDMTGRKLVFRRSAQAVQRAATDVESPPDGGSSSADEPGTGLLSGIFGALKDTVTIKPGTDLTEPTGTKWDAER
ncbi:MAG: hypothetical protein OXP07_11245 [Defluviicoccus sp.]|nr:hypothetical protein [Defluviicoccus sp.]